MRRFSRLLSRCLLLVMLTTLFSPSFAGEVVGVFALTESMHESHDHAAMAEPHGQQDGPCVDCPEHAAAGDMALHDDCDRDVDHHCCPGHVLGHLAGALGAMPAALPTAGSSSTLDRSVRRFSSRSVDGLERPPRAAA